MSKNTIQTMQLERKHQKRRLNEPIGLFGLPQFNIKARWFEYLHECLTQQLPDVLHGLIYDYANGIVDQIDVINSARPTKITAGEDCVFINDQKYVLFPRECMGSQFLLFHDFLLCFQKEKQIV